MQKNKQQCISIVLPAYREEKNVALVYKELVPVLKHLSEQYDYEVIFVDDGSPDGTWDEIVRICADDSNVKGIHLSRNFGKEIALTAGIEYARGDAVITLDGDWQHPVDKIPEFVACWKEGYDLVYNKRPKQEGATWWKRCSSRMFYWTYGILSDFPLEEYTTDYRLLDRKLVEIFKKFGERNRMYRGLTDWMGFKKRALVFDSKKRLDGGSATYGYKALYHLAVNSLTSFSVFPLRLVGYLGFLMTFLSVALFLFVIIDKFTVDQFNFSNIAAILLVNTTLIGVVLMGMGLMALYIARIHEEVQWRPMYLVQEQVNFDI